MKAFAKHIRLHQAEAVPVGSDVAVTQVHLSLRPPPTVHIGYAVGDEGTDGVLAARSVRTCAIPVEELPVMCPQAGDAMVQALTTVYRLAAEILMEARAVGPGTPTAG